MRGVRVLVVILFGVLGCATDDDPSETCSEGGKSYPPGAQWRCSDGCNLCDCSTRGGVVTTTGRACGDGGTSDTRPATCSEGGKRYHPGDSWLCSDSCNRCDCGPDGVVRMTGKACEAGADVSDDVGDPSDTTDGG